MARKFLTAIDLQKNELQNARVQNLASAPSSPVEGQIYYDTVDHKLYWRNASAWVDATGGGSGVTYGSPSSSAVGDSAADGVATSVTRSDHKHAREAFAAPTSETTFGASSATGSAATVAHSDHAHGNPAHDATAHSAIKLSDLAAPTADISLNTHKLTSVTDGVSASDAATVGQVQALINVGTNKTAVRVATTATGTLATAYENGDTVDGVTLATGDRILLKDQSSGAENGIYTVNASGTPTRATDADISAEVKGGLAVWINEGTVNADTRWVLTTNDAITLGSTALTFVQDFKATSTTAGAGLTASGGVVAVGAGTGISVGADSVAVDTSVVARYVVLATTGGSTSEVLTHSLGNQFCIVQIGNQSTPWETQEFDIEKTSTTTITIRSSANIAAGLKVTCIG